MSVIHVIGDLFANASRDGVVTARHFLGIASALPQETTVIFGQGLRFSELEFLQSICDARKLRTSEGTRVLQRAPGTHKHQPENILLRGPISSSLGEDVFRLHVDACSELVQDHQTGKHLPGAVGPEAARQAGMAAFTNRYLAGDDSGMSFIWDKVEMHFPTYLFPLATNLIVRLEVEKAKSNRWKYIAEIEIAQLGMSWNGRLTYQCVPTELMSKIEESEFQKRAADLSWRSK